MPNKFFGRLMALKSDLANTYAFNPITYKMSVLATKYIYSRKLNIFNEFSSFSKIRRVVTAC